jgi:hypothetical protein
MVANDPGSFENIDKRTGNVEPVVFGFCPFGSYSIKDTGNYQYSGYRIDIKQAVPAQRFGKESSQQWGCR